MRLPTHKQIHKYLDRCIRKFVDACPKSILVGCPQVALVAAKALYKLGFEPRIMTGRVRTADGSKVQHIWVEIPEREILVETNPSQIYGYPLVSMTMDTSGVDDRYEDGILIEEPSRYPALTLTASGEDFFDDAAEGIADCFRRRAR